MSKAVKKQTQPQQALYNTLLRIAGEKIVTIVEFDTDTNEAWRESSWDMHPDGTVGYADDLTPLTPGCPSLDDETAVAGITNLFRARCFSAQDGDSSITVRRILDEKNTELYFFTCVKGRVMT